VNFVRNCFRRIRRPEPSAVAGLFLIAVTKFWKKGALDYKKIPELPGVDLERYRGAARQEIRLTVG
jgi:hypothetical protein